MQPKKKKPAVDLTKSGLLIADAPTPGTKLLRDGVTPEVGMEVMDAQSLGFKDKSFDSVVEMCTFQHIKDYQKALSEIHRVLKKGGNLCIFDVGKYFLWPFMGLVEPFEGDFTKADILKALREAGFRIVKHKGGNVFLIQARK